MKKVIVGLDVGTSSMKAAVVNADGVTEEFLTCKYEMPEILPGVVHIDNYINTMRKLLEDLAVKYELLAVSVTTQMYSVCEAREDGIYVHQWNSLWQKNREVERKIGNDLVNSGCRPDTLYPAYKLASLNDEERRCYLPYGLKEHLIRFLCGSLATDYCTASASGLFDVMAKDWNYTLTSQLGYKEEDLPAIYMHNQKIGHVLEGCFRGASQNTAVVAGLGDGPSASLACSAISSFCGNLGTSMAARVLTTKPDFSKENGLWNLAVDDFRYVVGGISSNSFTVFKWIEKFGLKIPEKLSETGDLYFYPWLYGERTPFWSSDLRAMFEGASIEDGPEAFESAVCKAVAFTFVRMARAVGKVANDFDPLVLLGGGTNIKPLLALISGSLNRQIVLLEDETYLGALGAVISAGEAINIHYTPSLKISEVINSSDLYMDEYEKWKANADAAAKGMMRECRG